MNFQATLFSFKDMIQKKLSVIFLLLFFHLSLSAENVNSSQALSIAYREIKNREPNFEFISQYLKTVVVKGTTVYYIISYFPEGWALISADDVAAPLLAYSSNGNYKHDNQPESLQNWMRIYSNQILELKQKNNIKKHPEWENTSVGLRSTTAKIEPFITVNWNQGSPYNAYCPSNIDGRAVVGCVAVAMAQAMSVSRTPARPKGSTSYSHPIYGALGINYDLETPYKWNDIISGANNKSETARLLYHCGIAVKMSYGKDGSGAYTADVPAALKQYFSYSSSVKYHARYSNTSDWEKLLQSELQAGRPIIYSGDDGSGQAGHAFNLDGYDGTSMYHVNWGWSGQNNGYYRIDNLHDQYANYTQGHAAIVGIKPISYAPSTISLSNTSIQENVAVGTSVGNIAVESEIIPAEGYDYELKGAYNIFLDEYMPAKFYVENDVLKSKEVFIYTETQKTQTVYIKAINKENKLSCEKMFTISILKNTAIHSIESNETIQIYTNNKILYIKTDESCQYALYSLTGQKMEEIALSAGEHPILMHKYEGCYLITIRLNNTIYTKKIVL